ncbi:MAG TPA: glycosyltransferase family 9 protein, partial [Rhodocyclaceae bacterium]|nr:glycosyltransferase family 9 protein [Rhodocyclaceae bacterium]
AEWSKENVQSMTQTEIEDLLRQGRVAQARALADDWLSHAPDALLALQYQGSTRLFCGDAIGAEESFRKALALSPSLARNRANLGIALMTQGRYAEGLPFYESRYASDIAAHDRVSFAGLLPQRQWRGEALAGRRLLLVREQGYGDQIQFIRFAPQLRQLGAGRVTAWVTTSLAMLFTGVEGLDAVTEAAPADTDYDLWCPLLSLPLLLKLTAPQVPDKLPYLSAPTQRAAEWCDRIDRWAPGKSTLGIVWAGSPGNSVDARRSLPIELMLKMMEARHGAVAFSLQVGAAGMERLERQCGDGMIPLLDMLNDFADTAAVIERLDLVITVDTAVAHLAGALGKQVWLLLPAGPDWRWGLRGCATPWYPTMKIFRQPVAGDWASVVDEVTTMLANR